MMYGNELASDAGSLGALRAGQRPNRQTWRAAARVAVVLLLALAAAAMVRPPVTATVGPSAVARACDSTSGDWVYLGRLGAPFLPCPSR